MKKGIFRRDIFGTREHKYQFLSEHNCSDIEREEYRINPREGRLFFKNNYKSEKYENEFWKIDNIFTTYGLGLLSKRDKIAIGRSRDILFKRISDFCFLSEHEAREHYNIKRDSRDWKLLKAQKDAILNLDKNFIREILYRPFDIQYTLYNKEKMISRGIFAEPRYNIMQYLLRGKNLGMAYEKFRSSVIVTDTLIDMNSLGGGAYLFPLYLYNEDLAGAVTKTVNFTKDFRTFIKEKYNGTHNEIEIFGYIYGILNSSFYKHKYADYLKQDFAKIPFTQDCNLFRQLSELGNRLIQMHILQEVPDICAGDFKEIASGDNLISHLCYKEGRVYINDNKYFDGVIQSVWDYTIGHNKVIKHYLDSRKKTNFGEPSELTLEEISHLEKVIKVLTKTLEIHPTLDEVYKQIEESI